MCVHGWDMEGIFIYSFIHLYDSLCHCHMGEIFIFFDSVFVDALDKPVPEYVFCFFLILFTESVPVYHHCPGHRHGGQLELWLVQHSYSSHLHY